MTTNNSSFVVPSRQPAARVAGQRRRLSRPPRVPRSNTLPVLNRGAASGGNSGGVCGGTGSGIHTGAQEGATSTHAEAAAVPLEASQSMMNLRPPMGVPTEGPIIHDRRQVGDNASPAPTAESATSLVAESSKKKNTLTLRNPFSSSSKQSLEQTPFPPDTPTKAARLLGVDAPEGEERPRTAHRDTSVLDGVSDECLSTSDEDENAAPKSNNRFWKKTAQKMSVALSDLVHSSPPPPLSRYSQANLDSYARDRATNATLETNYVHSIGHDLSSSSSSSSSTTTTSDRKGKGKARAPLPRIAETSRDHEAGDAELDVIQEYTAFPPRGDSLVGAVRSPLQVFEDRLLDEVVQCGCAKEMTITRVTPGMVKLVDIPARKKK